MRSGKLDRRITIQTRAVSYDADGGEVITWDNTREQWAERETPGATERFVDAQRVANVDTLFRLRWNDDVMNNTTALTNRIMYRDRWYEILAVVEIGRREGIWIACTSRADMGGEP